MIIWIIAAAAAGFIKGLCGIGDAPVFASILSFSANNIDISPVSVVPSLVTNIIIAWQNRKSLQRRIWVPMALLLIAGTIPGILLLRSSLICVLPISVPICLSCAVIDQLFVILCIILSQKIFRYLFVIHDTFNIFISNI